MVGYYELKKAADGQFMFNLRAGNNEVVLTSETYTTKRAAEGGIDSVRANAGRVGAFERRKAVDGSPYFVLKAANGEPIGCSETYSSASSMEHGIASVRMNAASTTVKEL
jgi:uncharacterized protein